MKTEFRKWISVGAGVGIVIAGERLEVTITRVRPNGVSILGSATVTDYLKRPAAEWGAELLAFQKSAGAGHIAATVLLPRADVVVREIQMPGVGDKDLTAAIALQIESLHPFADDDIVHAWARIGDSASILIGIAKRETVDRYAALFTEAGIKIAAFVFSASAIYSALRILREPPKNFIAAHDASGALEIYGESDSRPVFSAGFDPASPRAAALAASELRLEPGVEAVPLSVLLPRPSSFPSDHDPDNGGLESRALPYAASLAAACPWLSLDANLLPVELRKASSRLRLAPTLALAGVLFLLAGALAASSTYQERRYLSALREESRKLEPLARRAATLDAEISKRRARTQSIEEFRRRARYDMDTLGEITRLLASPSWVSGLDLTRESMQVAGEAEQAAVLLEIFDRSALLEKSEFMMPIAKAGSNEIFRIKSGREGSPR